MTNTALLDQIRPGMKVRTSDGKRLGKVREVYTRDAENYIAVASEAAKWKLWKLEHTTLFLPASAVRAVEGQHIHLDIDAKTAKGCTWRPGWIPAGNIDGWGSG